MMTAQLDLPRRSLMGCRRAHLCVAVIAFVTALPLFADADEERNRAILTLERMQTIATALGDYLKDGNALPDGYRVEDLRSVLTPRYSRELPTRDGWDTPLRYSRTGKE